MNILVTTLEEDVPLVLKGSLDPLLYDLSSALGDQWTSIDYDLQAERHGNECRINGTLVAQLQLPCARCLEPLPYKISVLDFHHTLEISNEDSIDLTPLIREDILLSFPIAASCQLTDGNKCPNTGVVYKEDDSRFADKRRDDVWAALENIKEN